MLLTDTVGFIRKLPHHLIEAFGSTLEEAKYADIIIHVVDCSNPQMELQMHVVYETLSRLGVTDQPVITVFNKADLLRERVSDASAGKGASGQSGIFKDFKAECTLMVSAKTGEGLEALREAVSRILQDGKVYLEKLFPYDQAGKLQIIRRHGTLLSEEYTEDGIAVEAYVPAEVYGGLL